MTRAARPSPRKPAPLPLRLVLLPPQGSIAYPVTVHSEEDYRQMEKTASEEELEDGRHFFCRTFYDVRLKR